MGVKHSSPLPTRRTDLNGNKSATPTGSQEDFARLNLHLKANINGYSTMGLTKLHLACEVGDVTKVVTLLLLGADPNIVTERAAGHVTPLIFAASNGHTLCALALLQRGACPNGTDAWGNTALFKAACYDHVDCVKALLKYGANPEVANHWGALPLQYAALQGHQKVVDVLIDAGCDPNCVGERNIPPPLSAAALRAQITVLWKLIKAGAHVNLPDNPPPYRCSTVVAPPVTMKTPLYYALYGTSTNQYYDTPLLVSQNGLTESTRESARKDCNFTQCVRGLISMGAVVHEKCLHLLGANILQGGYKPLSTIRLTALVLRATVHDKTMTGEMAAILKGVCDVDPTRHERKRRELVELIFRIGYTPPRADFSQITERFSETDSAELLSAFTSPRTLVNLSALTVRGILPGNPLSEAVKNLDLPPILYNEITMDCTMDSPWR